MEIEKAWDLGIRATGALLIILTGLLFIPFLGPMVFALLLAYIALPLRRYVQERVSDRDVMAGITVVIIIIGIVLPATLGLRVILGKSQEALLFLILEGHLASNSTLVSFIMEEGDAFKPWDQVLRELPIMEPYMGPVLERVTRLLTTLPDKVIQVFMFLVFLYYFIRDGPEHLAKLLDSLPPSHEDRVREYVRVADIAIYATIFGRFTTGIVCAISSAAGLYLLNIPNAIFLGILAGVIFIIPQIGVWLLYVPLAFYMASLDRLMLALLVLVLGIFIGLLDNVVYSLIVGDRMSRYGIHPVYTLVGLLGGLVLWGFKGLVLGPIVVALSLSFVHAILFPISEDAAGEE